MRLTEKMKNLPGKLKKQMQTALILACAVATFAIPAFGGGYSAVKGDPITSQAAAIEDIDLLLVGASAFGEARLVVTASDNEAIETFIANTAKLIGSKWQNLGLLIGARESLSGSTWNLFQSPTTLSGTEVLTYNNSTITNAYNKYKAFGYAMQNLNANAQKSQTTAVSIDEGLDAMSTAAIKLGSFGTEFLNDYNPGPVLLALYDSSYLATYSSNKLVRIVVNNQVLKNIVCLLGDKVGNTGLSFFVLLNIVIAVFGFGLSMLLTLLGNRNIGDGVRKFLTRIIIGTVGIYLIANLMSTMLGWVTDTVLNVGASEQASYVENNLNMYDWYLTGFSLPRGITLEIDSSGRFVFSPDIVRAINEYTYGRLVGTPTDQAMKERMENYTQNGNKGIASFITPSRTNASDEDAGAEGWATDAYYAIMSNYAQNKEDLLDGKDEEGSPLAGKYGVSTASQYFYMSSLSISSNGNGGWNVNNYITNPSYYGLNPISALNLVRSDFSGETITAKSLVHPNFAYVAFDVVNVFDTSSGSNNMNSITRFIASFTLILASMKGLITIFTAGFGGMISGGVKTAAGSAHGLGQAIGSVIALLFGIIGISVIMSMALSLLDTIYGVCKNLLVGTEVVEAFLAPVQDSVGDIPIIGSALVDLCKSIVDMILTLILSLTFPKLGGIPITVFAQFMADLPGRMAEKAQMIEGMLLSGRSSAGTGLGGPMGGGHRGGGQYGRQAQQMAGNAFANGAKQAASVMKAGAAAGGALLGASLSTAGKALNKKADGLEGKPNNPGISNWDDLSPEQQSAAAETAAAVDNWNEMDEDARQKALEEAGVYNDNAADSGNNSADGNSVGNDGPEAPDSINDAANAAEPVTSNDGSNGSNGSNDGAEPPTSGDAGAPPVSGDMSADSMNTADGAAAGDTVGDTASAEAAMDGAEAGAEDSMNTGDGAGGTDAGDAVPTGEAGDSLNVNEGDNMEGANQQFDTDVNQQNNMEAQSVDESRQLNTEEAGDLSETGGMDNTADMPNTDNMPTGAAGIGAAGAAASATSTTEQSGAGASGTDGAGTAQQGAGQTTHKSVNNNTQAGNKTSMNVNAKSQQTTKVNNGGDQSRTVNNQTDGAKPQPKTPKSTNGNTGNKSGQSMNGTTKSAWGKDMSIRDQRKARALHAVGDGLQMMGGNRSMGQGVKEAMKHAKDAAVAYTVPIELQNPETHPFLSTLRGKRQEQQKKNGRK